ncbi:venom protease-like [Phymastichus coffea]|uniref:venom protease-like n=1 Tax=Phymastichus coffea TaxID=108790 RepID=UPI00273C0F7F|nr:venom protease-like [Phymastichus coffea]
MRSDTLENPFLEMNEENKKVHLVSDADGFFLPKTFYPPLCGYSKAAHNRVVGGTEAKVYSWPWIAAIGHSKSKKIIFCGATLISKRHLITAAHCVEKDMSDVTIRLGEHNYENKLDGVKSIEVSVKTAVPHPKYNDISKQNDIAVLTLEKDVEFTDSIHPICLPLADDIKNRNFTGTHPFIAGWGATYYGGPHSNVLRESRVPVQDNSKCDEAYRHKKVIVNKRMLCAGYQEGGIDACQGDSGGPLMFSYNMSYYLIGVVSTGFRCAVPENPGLYTRVSEFFNFIFCNMQ